MARAIKFARPAGANAGRADDSTANSAEGSATARAIPFDLGPLLSPYRAHGRLSIRIESLPRTARFSAGRNNGDNSWSLTLDELEGLSYLPPNGMNDAHTLTIKILDLAGGSTLAVLDFKIEQDQRKFASLTADLLSRKDEAEVSMPAPPPNISTSTAAELLVRKGEARPSSPSPVPDLAAAAAQAALNLQQICDAWQAERNSILAQLEERTQARLAEARVSWEREAKEALVNAENNWKAEEAARLAASKALWQEQSERALSAARAEAVAARAQGDEAELGRLRTELAVVQTALADRESELTRWRRASERAEERWQRESEAALSKAAAAWKAAEAARLAAAEAQWQKDSAKALAIARAGAEAARHQGIEIEFNRLRAELEAVQATLTTREAELAEARVTIGQARERWQDELEAALAKAKTGAHEQGNKSEFGRPHAELAAVQATLADREAELAEAHAAIEQARERWQQELEAALSNEKKVWESREIERLVAAKAQWQEKSSKALAAARAESEGARDTANAIEVRRLHAECTALQAVVAAREAELSQIQAAAERDRELGAENTHIVLTRDRIRNRVEEEELKAPAQSHLLRDGILATCLALSVVVFYPRIEAFIYGSPAPISSPGPEDTGAPAGSAVPSVAPGSPSRAAAEQPTAVVIHAANVRTGPSGGSDVIATLQLGVKVAIIEQRGSWTLIQTSSESNAKPQQGWVYSSFLKSADGRDIDRPAGKP